MGHDLDIPNKIYNTILEKAWYGKKCLDTMLLMLDTMILM